MGKKLPKKISSYLASLLKVLSKPQKKHLIVYLVGLIWLVKFRSIREIACQFGHERIDNLHHFMKDSVKKTKLLEEANQRLVSESFPSQEALLILDDTACPREGEKIEGLGIHHGSDGFVKGLCAVTAILKQGSGRLVWAIRGYRPKRGAPPGAFKSKVQLAREILEEAFGFFPKGLTVVMDAWYACAPILNPIQEAGWVFLAAVRSNRVLILNGQKTWASHLAKGPRKYQRVRVSKKKRFRVAKLRVYLPQIGLALLFITKARDGIRFFITNHLDMTESQMVRQYSERFTIEIFHKEIKQILGFREMFMRSWEGVQTHWTLLGIAYNLISLWNDSETRSFRKMIRHFRETISHDSMLHLPERLRLTQ